MTPSLPNLLRFLPPWLRPERKVECAWVEERLAAYSDWDLPEDEFEAVEVHLRHCATCRRSLSETEAILQSLRAALPSADPATQFPRRSAAATMAYIRAAENSAETPASSILRRPRLARASLACMALLLLPILAFVAHFSSDNAKTEPGQAAPLPSTPAVASAVSDDTVVDLGVADQLQQEFSETLDSLELRAMIPTTEEELEAWARREYPADMWLYDLLRDQYGYKGSWQHLLRESGEFLRFDYPTSLDQPNCRSSIAALHRIARVAGFRLRSEPNGTTASAQENWISDFSCSAGVSLLGSPPQLVQQPIPSPHSASECPIRRYAEQLARAPEICRSVVLYQLVSARLSRTDTLSSLAPQWKSILNRIQHGTSSPECDQCEAPTASIAQDLCLLLRYRDEFLQPIEKDEK